MDIGGGGWEHWRDGLDAWIGKIVAITAGLFAIWRGSKFAAHRIRQVWKTLSAFADSVEVLQALRLKQEEMQAIQLIQIELSRTPLWKADANGNCIEANTAYLQLLGLTFEEARGGGWEASIHPDDRNYALTAWNSAVREKAPYRSMFRIQTETETVRVEVRAFPAKVGDTVQFYGASTVISRKARTAE